MHGAKFDVLEKLYFFGQSAANIYDYKFPIGKNNVSLCDMCTL